MKRNKRGTEKEKRRGKRRIARKEEGQKGEIEETNKVEKIRVNG